LQHSVFVSILTVGLPDKIPRCWTAALQHLAFYRE